MTVGPIPGKVSILYLPACPRLQGLHPKAMLYSRLIKNRSVVIVFVLFCTSVSIQAAKPNILWIIAEDMGPELACYGTPEVRTPALDTLAKTGVRYTNAFTVTGVCSTSRSSFMTGMYAMSIGAHNHRSNRDGNFPLPGGVRVLTD